MAVVQATKHKFRPVLDFRELNNYLACHRGSHMIDICEETMETSGSKVGLPAVTYSRVIMTIQNDAI